MHLLWAQILRKTIQSVLDGFQKRKKTAEKLLVLTHGIHEPLKCLIYYAPLRSGTDIPFIGGMIKYAIENNLIP